MAGLEQNKSNVVAFYDLMFNQCKPADAIRQFAGVTYIQHNPAVADDKDAFIEYFNRMAAEHPGRKSQHDVLADTTTESTMTVSVFIGTSLDGFIARPNGDLTGCRRAAANPTATTSS